jgi:hypothetical protein
MDKELVTMIRAGLPKGYRQKIAKRMGVHPNTVDNIRETGESHLQWRKMVKVYNELLNIRK